MSGPAPGEGSRSDRRQLDRRAAIPIAELTLPELRRIVITSVLFAIVLALFLWMVRAVIIAAILGLVVGVYLRPLDLWLRERTGSPTLAALASLAATLVPFVALVVYSYFELIGVAGYLREHPDEIAREINTALQRLPALSGQGTADAVRDGVASAVQFARDIPGRMSASLGHFAVAATIFLVTAFYVLTRGGALAAAARARIPLRYAELTRSLEENVRGVLYGTVYASIVTQAIKSAVVLALNLVFGVPLAAVLAVLSFVIGFFPVVGSWSVYVPVAAWLLVFRADTFAAIVVLAVGFLVNTLFISTYLRPKIAADKSHVLDFYWMFVGLVTGVYTFGLAGVVLGPILIGLLKAILDTVTAGSSWRVVEPDPTEP